jgi:hypothetical protein
MRKHVKHPAHVWYCALWHRHGLIQPRRRCYCGAVLRRVGDVVANVTVGEALEDEGREPDPPSAPTSELPCPTLPLLLVAVHTSRPEPPMCSMLRRPW